MPTIIATLANNITDQQAIDTLLTLAETYAGHANTIGQQTTGTVKGAREDESLKKAEADLKVCDKGSTGNQPVHANYFPDIDRALR